MTVREQCIDYVKSWCNNSFINVEGVEVLPPSVVLAVDRMMQGLNNAPSGVTAKTVEGAFVSGSDIIRVFMEVKELCRAYRKIRSL
jgi:hypothetical protein